MELSDALNEVLSKKWTELRGIQIYSFGMNSVTAPKEDEDMIKQLQKSAVMRDPGMAAATLAGAQADDGERRGPVLRRRLSGVRSQGKILLPCR